MKNVPHIFCVRERTNVLFVIHFSGIHSHGTNCTNGVKYDTFTLFQILVEPDEHSLTHFKYSHRQLAHALRIGFFDGVFSVLFK